MPPSVWYMHYTPKACIIIHKICVRSSPNTSWSANWAVGEKEAGNTFVGCNKDPLLIHCCLLLICLLFLRNVNIAMCKVPSKYSTKFFFECFM